MGAVPLLRAAVPPHREAVLLSQEAVPQSRAVVPQSVTAVPPFPGTVPQPHAPVPQASAAENELLQRGTDPLNDPLLRVEDRLVLPKEAVEVSFVVPTLLKGRLIRSPAPPLCTGAPQGTGTPLLCLPAAKQVSDLGPALPSGTKVGTNRPTRPLQTLSLL